jgi:hypothetical protein
MRIENLSKELDTKALTDVRGGDNGNSATNQIGQELNLSVPVCVQGCGPTNSSVNVNGSQNAQIWNSQYGSDSFGLFPSFETLVR